MAEGEREGPDAHAALALVATFAKAAREELLGFAPRPPTALPAHVAPEVQPRPGSGVASVYHRSWFGVAAARLVQAARALPADMLPEVQWWFGVGVAYSQRMQIEVSCCWAWRPGRPKLCQPTCCQRCNPVCLWVVII